MTMVKEIVDRKTRRQLARERDAPDDEGPRADTTLEKLAS